MPLVMLAGRDDRERGQGVLEATSAVGVPSSVFLMNGNAASDGETAVGVGPNGQRPRRSDRWLFRAMRATGTVPEIGRSARTLGARPTDIPIDQNRMVYPDHEGMSVSPDSPANLPDFMRPPDFGGSGKDQVWGIRESELGPDLAYRPDPVSPHTHGFIEPTRPMPFDRYHDELGSTQDRWLLIDALGWT